MSFQLYIAKRYLYSRKRYGHFSVHAIISVLGVAAGVAALIIVLAVFNGLNHEIKTRIIGFEGHVGLHLEDSLKGLAHYHQILEQINQNEHVIGSAPYIEELALISASDHRRAIQVKGVDPQLGPQIMQLKKFIISGQAKIDSVICPNAGRLPGLMIGYGLARNWGLQASDSVYITSAAGLSISNIGFANPEGKWFGVQSVFKTDLIEVDHNVVLCELKAAQSLFHYGNQIGGIEIKLDNINRSNQIAQKLRTQFQKPFVVETWFQKNKMLFSWMRAEKWGAFLILFLIVIVAGFNIISTLIMTVIEKTNEIGILKSIGVTDLDISKLFLIQGTIVGVVGTILGVFIGYLGCWLQDYFKLFSLPSGEFFMDALPVRLQLFDTVVIAIVAIILSILASYYPARKASQLDPVQAIRYQG